MGTLNDYQQKPSGGKDSQHLWSHSNSMQLEMRTIADPQAHSSASTSPSHLRNHITSLPATSRPELLAFSLLVYLAELSSTV